MFLSFIDNDKDFLNHMQDKTSTGRTVEFGVALNLIVCPEGKINKELNR